MTSTKSSLSVGALSAEPGTKTRGTVPADLGTLTVDIPLTLVNGARPGPRVLDHRQACTAASSPASTRPPGSRPCWNPARSHGQVVVCPVANPPAVYQGRLGVSPLDGVNINRVFPGDPDGGPTERLAAWLFAHLVDGADAYVDLHSGGIDEVLTRLRRLPPHRRLRTRRARRPTWPAPSASKTSSSALNAEGGNSHAAAARQGIPAILVETGQLGERDPETARRLVGGLYGLLRRLGVLEAPQHPHRCRAAARLGLDGRGRVAASAASGTRSSPATT